MQKYFLGLKRDTPSMSPVDKKWPARPYRFLDEAHRELQRIFHLWRVGAALHLVQVHIYCLHSDEWQEAGVKDADSLLQCASVTSDVTKYSCRVFISCQF